MVSNEEIKRRLELKRKGIEPDKKSSSDVYKPPIKSRTPVKLGTQSKKEISCPKCGAMNFESSKFCISCGNKLKKENKVEIKEIKSKSIICPDCQTENAESSRFCIGCGKYLKDTPAEVAEKDIKEITVNNQVEHETSPEETDLLEVSEETDDKASEELDLSNDTKDSYTELKKTDFFEEIKKAKELLDLGAITEDEYEKIKNSYLKQFE